MEFPPELAVELEDVARAADLAANSDPELARALCERELEILRVAEEATGHRVHKGHALHNLGAATLALDPAKARHLFHAAYAEDVRTSSTEVTNILPTPAGQTLAEMYGKSRDLLNRLAREARDTTSDPMELARAFGGSEDLPPYRGFRRLWRNQESLDGVPAEQLVFVAGSHGFPDRMLALRRAVVEVGLDPVLVIEFEDFGDAFTKSRTLLLRCGAALFDVSFPNSGWQMELVLAREHEVPFWAGHVAFTAFDLPHMWSMTSGLLGTLGVEPVAAPDDDALRREAVAWLRGRVPRTASQGTAPTIGQAPFVDQRGWSPPAPGTAVVYGPFAQGSNTDHGRFFLEEPAATTSGWSAPDVSFDPTIEVPKFKLVDGQLVRDERQPRNPWSLLPPDPDDVGKSSDG